MKVEKIILPNQDTLPKNERGYWVCYYTCGAKHAKEFHDLLKKSGIISLGWINYKDNRKVYYVTRFGGVFSIDKKKFNDAKHRVLNLAQYLSDKLIGRSLEDDINESYEVTF